MTRADREDAIERLNAIKQFMGYDEDSELVKATQKSLDMAIVALKREQQFLDAGYKNGRVEFMIGGRKFMVKEMAQ